MGEGFYLGLHYVGLLPIMMTTIPALEQIRKDYAASMVHFL